LCLARLNDGTASRKSIGRRLGMLFWPISRVAFDFGVSFTPEDIAAGRALYNYGTVIRNSQDMFGVSIFVKDGSGAVFHSNSTYHRGTKLLMGAFKWLDLTPKGRNEIGGP
jgi:predicted dithiol-disulfide oxidoreductase (DUF899 family)